VAGVESILTDDRIPAIINSRWSTTAITKLLPASPHSRLDPSIAESLQSESRPFGHDFQFPQLSFSHISSLLTLFLFYTLPSLLFSSSLFCSTPVLFFLSSPSSPTPFSLSQLILSHIPFQLLSSYNLSASVTRSLIYLKAPLVIQLKLTTCLPCPLLNSSCWSHAPELLPHISPRSQISICMLD
jgi:hypothetical protein